MVVVGECTRQLLHRTAGQVDVVRGGVQAGACRQLTRGDVLCGDGVAPQSGGDRRQCCIFPLCR